MFYIDTIDNYLVYEVKFDIHENLHVTPKQ